MALVTTKEMFAKAFEGKYSIGSCSDGVDNNFDGKIDMEDAGCKN